MSLTFALLLASDLRPIWFWPIWSVADMVLRVAMVVADIDVILQTAPAIKAYKGAKSVLKQKLKYLNYILTYPKSQNQTLLSANQTNIATNSLKPK